MQRPAEIEGILRDVNFVEKRIKESSNYSILFQWLLECINKLETACKTNLYTPDFQLLVIITYYKNTPQEQVINTLKNKNYD